MEKIHILLFYKFVDVSDYKEFASEHLKFCKSLGIKGKVLFAKEGVNGSVSGTKEQMEAYKKELTSDERFSDIVFKEETDTKHPFKSMFVRARNDIIRLGKEVDMKMAADYIQPEEFLEMYKKGEKVVVVDARNDYEWKVGKFKDAVTLDIETFREFPEAVEKLDKNAKIVTYCTGGIRCEKASAYMRQIGFNNVRQLEGGIITFCQKFPDTVWEGGCFVFDDRLVSHVGQKEKPIAKCDCGVDCYVYKNCKNLECNKLMVSCDECDVKNDGLCGECVQEKLLKVR